MQGSDLRPHRCERCALPLSQLPKLSTVFIYIIIEIYTMQIFELHFNPKLKEDQVFDSFVYEPESAYEKKLGSLYVAGELQNSLRSDSNFLDNLAQTVKKSYYTLSINYPEKALSYSSKKANEFLAEEVKKEHINWLGNLNFAIFSLSDFNLNFTKTGDLKILLIRQGQIIDIGKNLDLQEIDPYPLKIFFNTVSGKLIENDKILVLTKQLFDFFKEKNILSQIARIQNELNSKKLKEILPASLFSKGEGTKVSGLCLIAVLTSRRRQDYDGQAIIFQNKKKLIPFEIPKIHPVKYCLAVISPLVKLFNRVNLNRIKLSKMPKIPKIAELPRLTIKKPGFLIEKFKGQKNIKKNLILIVILTSILFFGFYLFEEASNKKEKEIGISLEKIENPEIAQELNPDQPETEYKKILYSLSGENLIFSPPDTVFVLKSNQWQEKNIDLPSFDFNLDLFSSYLSNLYFLDQETCKIVKYQNTGDLKWGPAKIWPKESEEACSNPKSITVDGSVWILNKNNSILRYYSGSLKETIKLDFFPYPENISIITTRPNLPYLYLLEPIKNRVVVIEKTGRIAKQFQSDKFNNLKDIVK